MADKERTRSIPPYVPWRTFENYLDGLKAFGPTLPNVIDRDSMRTYSGAMQSWLLSALRALNMVDDNGVPRPRLQQIVHATQDDRKPMYRQLIEAEYHFLKDINLQGATPKQIETAFESTGATGDTVFKCMGFFVGLAKAAELPLSPLILKVRRRPRVAPQNGGSTVSRPKKAQDTPTVVVVPEVPRTDSAKSAMKTIALPQAKGRLSLTGTFNMFDLEGDERELVFFIIDKMKAFEKAHPAGEEEEP